MSVNVCYFFYLGERDANSDNVTCQTLVPDLKQRKSFGLQPSDVMYTTTKLLETALMASLPGALRLNPQETKKNQHRPA
jgi:hypothetical protein